MLGAAYLCWIGIKALRDAWRGIDKVAEVAPARRRRPLAKAFAEGFVTNALNPKVSMFYLAAFRSEEHTSELPSLMRTSYAAFCLKKQNTTEFFGLLAHTATPKYHR